MRRSAVWRPLAAAFVVFSLSAQVYEIGTGDVLRVSVTGQPTLTGEFPVDGTGMLNYPLLGKLKASGLSTQALEKKLATLLADGYLKRPEVNVTVKEYNSLRVFVTGEVAKPGPYPLKGDRSLLSLMSDLGTLQADVGHEVVIVRPPDADSAEGVGAATAPSGMYPNEVPGSQILKVNLRELLSGNPSKNVDLLPSDTVYFPKAANIYVTGHVARPGPLRYQEGMTVFQALTLAGGVTDKGSQKVKITRVVDGKPTDVKNVKLTDLLQPEDSIKVPEKFF